MTTVSFPISFRFDFKEPHETSFQLDLSDEEIAFIKAFVKENEGQPFWAMDYDNQALFERMLDAQMEAIVSCVNKEIIEPGESPFTKESVNWEYVPVSFDWPSEFKPS